jgi:hypothetical protein
LCGDASEPKNIEDALPQWLRKFAAAQGQERFIGTAYGKPFNGALPPAARVSTGKYCNSWMGDTFDVPAKPLLLPLMLGERCTLLPGEQELIARWIAKTALMTELALGTAGRVPDRVYHGFRRSGYPPPQSRVLLGCYSDGGLIPDTPPNRISVLPQQPTLASLPSGHWSQAASSPIIGSLAAQFVLPLSNPRFRSIAERQGFLVTIWPPTNREMQWPPPALDRRTAALCEQWELCP